MVRPANGSVRPTNVEVNHCKWTLFRLSSYRRCLSMSLKKQFAAIYVGCVALFWVCMSLSLAAAKFVRIQAPPVLNPEAEYIDLFIEHLSDLSVAMIMVPAIGVYSYRLVMASESKIGIALRLLGAVLLYYITHISFFMIMGLSNAQFDPIRVVSDLSHAEWIWGVYFILSMITGGLATGLYHKERELRKSEAEVREKLGELEAEFAAEQNKHLKQRLGSHFVLNALSNVIALVRKGEQEKAIDGLHTLSGILREIAHGDGDSFCSLKREFEFLEKYLSFQKIRFPDLEVIWDIDPKTTEKLVPRHILQPLVENSFKHGMQAGGKLGVYISAQQRAGYTLIEICNSIGTTAVEAGTGEGHTLTVLRLEKAFGRRDLFKCVPSQKYYRVELKIPIHGEVA